jgi:integrase/recombinase XerD
MRSFTSPQIYPANLNPKNSWFVAFRCTNPATGKTKQFQFRGEINRFTSKREKLIEANSLIQVLDRKLADGWDPFSDTTNKNQSDKTLYSLLDELLEIKRSTLKVKSYRSYNDAKNMLQKWLLEKNMKLIMPGAFTPKTARHFADFMLVDKKYSGKTFNGMIGFLKTYFNMMIEREVISDNPFAKIKRMQHDIGSNHAFSEREKKALIELIKRENKGLYYYVSFMYHCFIRRTELTRLKVGDIDLKNRTIRISSKHSKNRHQDSVSIPDGLLSVIKAMDLSNDDHYIFGHGMKPGPKYYKNPNLITDMHRKFLKQLGIKFPKTLYSWKHTGVCDYYNVLKDPYVIMRQLRHHDLSITMVYLKSLGLAPNLEMQNANIVL